MSTLENIKGRVDSLKAQTAASSGTLPTWRETATHAGGFALTSGFIFTATGYERAEQVFFVTAPIAAYATGRRIGEVLASREQYIADYLAWFALDMEAVGSDRVLEVNSKDPLKEKSAKKLGITQYYNEAVVGGPAELEDFRRYDTGSFVTALVREPWGLRFGSKQDVRSFLSSLLDVLAEDGEIRIQPPSLFPDTLRDFERENRMWGEPNLLICEAGIRKLLTDLPVSVRAYIPSEGPNLEERSFLQIAKTRLCTNNKARSYP